MQICLQRRLTNELTGLELFLLPLAWCSSSSSLDKEKLHLVNGLLHVRWSDSPSCSIYQLSIASDIIALLIVGIIFVGLFLCWQYYLEKRFDDHNSSYSVFTPPPLMRITLWTRAHGRLGVVMLVAFTTWSCFSSWLYWIQVRSIYSVRYDHH